MTLEHKKEFADSVFTKKELGFTRFLTFRDHAHALYFSMKEAVLKALGCGIRFGTFWRDIEIGGQSGIRTTGRVKDFAAKKSIKKIHAASARTQQYALSVVLLESED